MKVKILIMILSVVTLSICFFSVQQLAASYDTSKSYKIINRYSGKALEVYNWSTTNNGNIVQYDDLEGYNQQWRIVDIGQGYHKIVNQNSIKAMEVYNWQTTDGANIAQYADWNGLSQQWQINDLGNGYVSIINRFSGKALEVYEWSLSNGANVVQWDFHNGLNQQWQIVEVEPEETITVNETIVVKSGQTFDGEGKRYVANPDTLGDGGQAENQKSVFLIEDGATIKNVVLGHPAADGIHTYGDAVIQNVVWEDIGEDALTVKASGNVIIRGGMAQHGYDKMFQINAPSNVEIYNFTALDAGKMVRQVGGSTFHVSLKIEGSVIKEMNEAIFRTDSTTSSVIMANTRYSDVGSKWYNVKNVTENNNVAY